jgi:tripartite-type tricarboxylate transporter receptor subunit TctC
VPNRRQLVVAAIAALAAPLLPCDAAAQALSNRPIRIIVPFTAGTGMDLLARLVGEQLRQRWDQPVVVDNRPGASGNIGSEAVARAAPDGHTLMMTANTFVITPPLYKNVPYDPVKDFSPIGLVAVGQLALAVHPSVKAASAGEFIAAAKEKPGAMSYSSPGVGTPQHLSMESLKLATGIDILHVPYKGSAGAVQDLVGGQVAAMVIPVHTGLPLAADNRIRLLGVISAERSPVAPQLPTFAEQGIKGVDVDLWYGLYAPASTPADIVKRLNEAVNAILADAAVKEQIAKQGLVAKGGTPEELGKLTAADLARWTKVIETAGIKAE